MAGSNEVNIIVYPCEYAAHGKWGKESSPATHLVQVKCLYCDDSDMLLFMCHECRTADRIVSCAACGGEQHPRVAWTPTLRWFN